MRILVINGANLNMLGQRDKKIYGNFTLEELNEEIKAYAENIAVDTSFYQSNSEGEIIDKLQNADADGIILNAGAYSHYSYAIRDAIECIKIPVVEVHISNIYKRDEFRHKSVVSEVCAGTISGFGMNSYLLAIDYFTL